MYKFDRRSSTFWFCYWRRHTKYMLLHAWFRISPRLRSALNMHLIIHSNDEYFAFFTFYAHTKWMNLDIIGAYGLRRRCKPPDQFVRTTSLVRVNHNTMRIICRIHSTSESWKAIWSSLYSRNFTGGALTCLIVLQEYNLILSHTVCIRARIWEQSFYQITSTRSANYLLPAFIYCPIFTTVKTTNGNVIFGHSQNC